MKKYKKDYFKKYDVGEQNIILCANCGAVAVDLHHWKFKSHCGPDETNNLIPLCRNCHEKAHNDKQFNQKLKKYLGKAPNMF